MILVADLETVATLVLEEADIQSRIAEMGDALTRDFYQRDPVFVVMLSGSVPFAADLLRCVKTTCEIDFMGLNRFGESGRVGVTLDTSTPLFDRHVVIVEDIVDTGLTLKVLRTMMLDRGAQSVSTVALLDKHRRRMADVPIEYRGFEVGDEFLVGYGLDWKGKFRNLRSLWAVLDLDLLEQQAGVMGRAVAG